MQLRSVRFFYFQLPNRSLDQILYALDNREGETNPTDTNFVEDLEARLAKIKQDFTSENTLNEKTRETDTLKQQDTILEIELRLLRLRQELKDRQENSNPDKILTEDENVKQMITTTQITTTPEDLSQKLKDKLEKIKNQFNTTVTSTPATTTVDLGLELLEKIEKIKNNFTVVPEVTESVASSSANEKNLDSKETEATSSLEQEDTILELELQKIKQEYERKLQEQLENEKKPIHMSENENPDSKDDEIEKIIQEVENRVLRWGSLAHFEFQIILKKYNLRVEKVQNSLFFFAR